MNTNYRAEYLISCISGDDSFWIGKNQTGSARCDFYYDECKTKKEKIQQLVDYDSAIDIEWIDNHCYCLDIDDSIRSRIVGDVLMQQNIDYVYSQLQAGWLEYQED